MVYSMGFFIMQGEIPESNPIFSQWPIKRATLRRKEAKKEVNRLYNFPVVLCELCVFARDALLLY
jgi:hypothetical protein